MSVPRPAETAGSDTIRLTVGQAVVRFLEAQSWALAGIVDGCIGVEEFTDNHLRELTDSVRDLGFDADDATETVRGIWRIALGEALIRSTPLIAAVDDRVVA